ncbi:hypothetical protein [Mycobacterium phage Fezzik]|nr:hypothetical protein [Mycobacterium phage Fezzik]
MLCPGRRVVRLQVSQRECMSCTYPRRYGGRSANLSRPLDLS